MTTASDARGGVLALGGLAFMVMAVAAAYLWRDRGEPEPTVAAAAPEKPLKVYFGGCHEVHEGPVCMLSGTATITLWMEDPGFEPVVLVDGRGVQQRVKRIDGGASVQLSIKSSASLIEINNSRWSLGVGSFEDIVRVTQVEALRQTQPKEALLETADWERFRDPHSRARMLSLRARLQHDLNISAWLETVQLSTNLHKINRCLSGMADDLAFMGQRLRSQGDIVGAQEALEQMGKISRAAPQIKIAHNYFSALLATQMGNPRAALSRLREMNRWSERLSDTEYHEASIHLELLLMSYLSRSSEAQELLGALSARISTTRSPCARGRMLNNFAWFSRRFDLEQSTKAAERAEIVYATSCTSQPADEILLRLTLGRLLLDQDRFTGVERQIGKIRSLGSTYLGDRNRIALEALEAQLLQATKEHERSLALFQSVCDRTGIHYEPRLHWEALVGLAQISLAKKEPEKAIQSLREAEGLLDLLVLSIPLGEGRAIFAEDHLVSTELMAETFLSLGKVEAASQIVSTSIRRHSSAMALAAQVTALPPERRKKFQKRLEEYRRNRSDLSNMTRDAWRMSRKERELLSEKRSRVERGLIGQLDRMTSLVDLDWRVPSRTLGQGESELLLHPLRGRTLAILRHSSRQSWALLDGVPAESTLRQWLQDEFTNAMDVPRYVWILAHGRYASVPVHSIIQASSPNPVLAVYSIGLPSQEVEFGSRRALVVSDPDGTLPNARSEGIFVKRVLEEAGWEVDLLVGEQASRRRLIEVLSKLRYGLLHFAGHSTSHGIGGWTSFLRVADRERLEVADIFSLEFVPDLVVLSSCEGGGDGDAPVGIAQALLARGATAVVAAAERIEDTAGMQLSSEIYENGSVDGLTRRLAALQWKERSESSAKLSRFRIFVR
ncbi:MAG: CHAT domain-containing protein [Deltaproteobacteria bacterium]